jgi:hypothetical protein
LSTVNPSPNIKRPSVPVFTRSVIRFFMKIISIWALIFIILHQGGRLAQGELLLHPMERIVKQVGLNVDLVIFYSSGQLDVSETVGLSVLKELAKKMTETLKGEDIPENWEINSDSGNGYQFVSYQGRTNQGTHWVITAYHIDDEPVQICLRQEYRYLPFDFKHSFKQMENQINSVAKGKASSGVLISGRLSNSPYGDPIRSVLSELKDFSVELKHTQENQTGQTAYLFTPFLPNDNQSYSQANLVIEVQNMGSQQRVNIFTPGANHL